MFILKQVNLKSNGKLFFQPFGLFLIPGRFLLMRVKYQSCANIQLDNYCKSRLQRLRLSSKFCPLLIFDEEKKDKCLLFWIFSLVEKQVFNICFHSADTQFGWILWISEGAEELSVIVLDLVSSMSSVGCRPNHIGQNTSTLPKCHIHTNRVI